MATKDIARFKDIFMHVLEAERKLAFARSALEQICADDPATSPQPSVYDENKQPAEIQSLERSSSGNVAWDVESQFLPHDIPTRLATGKQQSLQVLDEIVVKSMLHDDQHGTDGDETKTFAEYVILHSNHPDPQHRIEPQTMPRVAHHDARSFAQKTANYVNMQAMSSVMFVSAYENGFKLPIIYPHGKVRIAWVVINVPFICFESFSIPYVIAFETSVSGLYGVIAFVVNLYYLFDICVTSLTGYIDQEGKLVMRPGRILRHYVSTWLLIDLISACPWSWIAQDASAMRVSKVFRVLHTLRLLHVFRLMRMLHMKGVAEQVHMVIERSQHSMFFASMLKVLLLLCGVTHWAACIWYFIGTRSKEMEKWTQTYLEPKYTTRLEHYVLSLYFTLTTMTTVGYGDMTPQNLTEIIFTVFLLLVASIVFASLLGQISDLVSRWNSQSHNNSQKKTTLNRYMTWRAVPSELTVNIREHMLFVWEANGAWDAYEHELMGQLPPCLKSELCYHLYGRVLLSSPCFAWLGDYINCLKRLSNLVHAYFLDKDDHLFKRGEPCVQVHILLEGAVWLTQNESISASSDNIHTDLVKGATSFMIPRNKEVGLVDVGRSVLSSARESVHSLYAQKQVFKTLKAMQGSSDYHRTPTLDLRDGAVKCAAKKMKAMDMQLTHAAVRMQRAWRCKNTNKNAKSSKTVRRNIATMTSTAVHAPAYLGESCLWQPIECWCKHAPDPYLYSARCTVRCEVLIVARTSVQNVVDEFQPFLGERLVYFQECVRDAARDAADREREKTRDAARDAADRELEKTRDRSTQGEESSCVRDVARDCLREDPETKTENYWPESSTFSAI